MQKSIVLALLCLAALKPALAMETTEFARAIKSSHPHVQWQQNSVLKADLTCRAQQDVAMLGVNGSRLMVAILAKAVTKKPIVLEIDADLLAEQTTMSIESQDFEMGTGEPGDVGPLPGFKRSKICKGLQLDDDRIDSVHIYWNRIDGKFQTWQR